MFFSTVAVLRGGPSSEYDVSMQSGAAVLSALADSPYRTKDIIITRKGDWLVSGFVQTPAQALCDVDVVFNALHGVYGEDGTVQRIMDRLGVPYTGSAAYPSALAMNKQLTKEVAETAGIRTPPSFKVTKHGAADPVLIAQRISELFGPSYVLKPLNGGSSAGVQVATNVAELATSLYESLQVEESILIEKRIHGTEATVAVLEEYRHEKLYTFPPVEIIPAPEAAFFDYEAKYNGATQEICPGRFAGAIKEELFATAALMHTTLHLRHYSRSDFIVANDGVYFLETNTLPGLTNESLFPKAMHAVGGSYQELVMHLLNAAYRS